ncbi:thymidine phosphorylase [Rhodophyticola sp. CCM32]|uniref:thymidine phosphorylase n=1 Tax=Rhodophyticola sp. CCM32 TaxID=2916397 RepID=UPI00107F7696|nr:thymidine phosphorylase [Rhodophyticola sp. CCM32]QBY02781.1 thymidine phosphorylase [Rhodophyticola sp. CCM32]
MDARSILIKLREGQPLSKAEIYWFTKGIAGGEISDMQAGAFAMAICTRGISRDDRVHLTHGMLQTGEVLTWDLDGPVLDKHSTGGVGDTVSLLLAPALAVCGAYVPMISGRGLGHTGGTLDKLEAIPGYRTQISIAELQELVADIGCAIVGASGDIAPADKRLYGVRDVTGTVESIDLITASILSKKLAAGLEALVLDVKTGSGAFMADPADALALAQSLVETAQGAGCMCSALITDMNQPSAKAAGNALEVIEVMEVLTGMGFGTPLYRLTLALGGEVLALGGLAADAADGEARIEAALTSGQAAERFGEMVAALGGPADFVERWRDRLPAARVMVDVHPVEPGYVAAIDTRALGEAVVHLGGGRLVASDKVDPGVGLSDIAPIGARVDSGRPLLRIHAASEEAARVQASRVRDAYVLAERAPEAPPLIHERIG